MNMKRKELRKNRFKICNNNKRSRTSIIRTTKMMIPIMMIRLLVVKELYPKIKESMIINRQLWLRRQPMMDQVRSLKRPRELDKVHQPPVTHKLLLDQIKRCLL